ncbi:hypothetical protein BDW22DRAFT_238907 [Trametopsis cervina]|nr:hypothetical protein BDW22DRAFT_238907 [Trametopsis cervina]
MVHSYRLLASSDNHFGGLLPFGDRPPSDKKSLSLTVDEPYDVLNVVLHTVYGMSCDAHHPSIDCLSRSIDVFKYCGLPLRRYLSQNGSPLYTTILNHAVANPVEIYTIAASHSLEDLAIASSLYTLDIRLNEIPDAMADRIGTFYLQRLHKLHGLRMEHLQRLLSRSVPYHEEKAWCSAEKREEVSSAVHVAAIQLFYNATPAITRATIETTISSVADSVDCPDCKQTIALYGRELGTDWSLFGRTI